MLLFTQYEITWLTAIVVRDSPVAMGGFGGLIAPKQSSNPP